MAGEITTCCTYQDTERNEIRLIRQKEMLNQLTQHTV
jgi:hypothetical protein